MRFGKSNVLLAVAGTMALIATVAIGQDRQIRQANKPVIAGQSGSNSGDAQLAKCLIGANESEIALGKLAEQRATNKDVKQFAQMMVKDHDDFMKKLEHFAGSQADATQTERRGSSSEQRPGEAASPAGSFTAAQPMGSQSIDFVTLNRQIGQKCSEMIRKDLEEKEGSQFDRCYIGSQIGAHMHVLATLEVFRTQASPELAALLDKGIETTKTHLEDAQKIAKSLEK